MANISIHALREEGDVNLVTADFKAMDFYPRPPRGGRLGVARGLLADDVISIHALREEGDDAGGRKSRKAPMISIHALREEGDLPALRTGAWWCDFYPRPPRGGRLGLSVYFHSGQVFLSTPSARRATAWSASA